MIECPRCHLTFDPGRNPMQRLAAWYSGHVEPDTAPTPTPSPDGFAPVGFADPATSPGGIAHLTIGDASTGHRPVALAVVFVPSGAVAEGDRTPEHLLTGGYPADSVSIPDDTIVTIDVPVPGLAPGSYDVGVIATYID